MIISLDRLLLLLSTGSTPLVRQTAAKQLGLIAGIRIARGSHLQSSLKQAQTSLGSINASDAYKGLEGEWHEIVYLLVKVLPYLKSRSWETRLAAASAVECIIRAVGIWEPPPDHLQGTLNPFAMASTSRSRLAEFDIVNILRESAPLLACSGNEYVKAEPNGSNGQLGENEVVERLGLAVPGAEEDQFDFDAEKNFQHDEEQHSLTALARSKIDLKGKSKASSSPSPAPALVVDSANDLEKLSAREKNALKRKRKAAGPSVVNGAHYSPTPFTHSKKVRVVDIDRATSTAFENSSSRSASPAIMAVPMKKEEIDEDNPALEMLAGRYSGSDELHGSKVEQIAEDHEHGESSGTAKWIALPDQWPFHRLVVSLQSDLLESSWEVRHGAALGLRELLKLQGHAGGMTAGASSSANLAAHEEWCEVLADSLLRVLALDRFGDFVGDQVMAPVRETASQTLAALSLHVSDSSAYAVQDILLKMIAQENFKELLQEGGKTRNYWEVRHAGLLGLKYFVAVHRDLFDQPVSSPGQAEKRRSKLKGILDVALVG